MRKKEAVDQADGETGEDAGQPAEETEEVADRAGGETVEVADQAVADGSEAGVGLTVEAAGIETGAGDGQVAGVDDTAEGAVCWDHEEAVQDWR